MSGEKKNNKAVVIGLVVLIIAAAVLGAVYFIFREKPSGEIKNITIEVVGKSQQSTSYSLTTDAEYLRGAMEETDGLTFSGTESEYGLMVETVNGDTADFSADSSYWAFYVNGEYCNYGIDTQPVADGDRFSIVYTIYSDGE